MERVGGVLLSADVEASEEEEEGVEEEEADELVESQAISSPRYSSSFHLPDPLLMPAGRS